MGQPFPFTPQECAKDSPDEDGPGIKVSCRAVQKAWPFNQEHRVFFFFLPLLGNIRQSAPNLYFQVYKIRGLDSTISFQDSFNFFLFYSLSKSLKINQALKREFSWVQFYFAFHWIFCLWWKSILYLLLIYGSKEVVGKVGEKNKNRFKDVLFPNKSKKYWGDHLSNRS